MYNLHILPTDSDSTTENVVLRHADNTKSILPSDSSKSFSSLANDQLNPKTLNPEWLSTVSQVDSSYQPNQFSEVELLQSALASPDLLDLNDNNDKAAEETIDVITDDFFDSYNKNKNVPNEIPTTMIHNSGNNNYLNRNSNEGLKYTRSIGRNDDDLNIFASKYNTDDDIASEQNPIKFDKLILNERLNLPKQQTILSDHLLLDRLLLADYMNSLYNNNNDVAAADIIEMLPSTTTTTASGILSRFANNHPKALPRIVVNNQRLMSNKNDGPQTASLNQQQNDNNDDNYWINRIYHNNHTVHLFALIAAILGACLAVKLVLRGGTSTSPSHEAGLLRRNFTRFGNNSRSSFRSLWSSQSTISGELDCQQAKCQKPLNRANITGRRLSTTSSCTADSLLSNRKEANDLSSQPASNKTGTKSLDLLTQKLICLLKSHQQSTNESLKKVVDNIEERDNEEYQHDGDFVDKRIIDNNSEIIDVNSVNHHDDGITDHNNDADNIIENENGSHFRSSRSYIKSLIDVLSNARSQYMPNVVQQFGPNTTSSLSLSKGNMIICGDDDDDRSELLSKTNDNQTMTDFNSGNSFNQLDEPGIVMSQMDISAAHLILAYMEKHLEDKERLKREWLELNSVYNQQTNSSKQPKQLSTSGASNSSPTGPNLQQQADVDKIKLHMLQRLAKVALSDENKNKNRDPLIVPFDRNRVKLFGASNNACTTPPSNTSSNFSLIHSANNNNNAGGRTSKQTNIACNIKNNKKLQQRYRISDYINASFIYDDDPRKPTHIIAQGPTEQTTAQFWQMIWEQGISVIVMLTRLNENSQRMCHCYWPTNVAQMQQTGNNIDNTTTASRQQSLDVVSFMAADTATSVAKPTTTVNNNSIGSNTTITNITTNNSNGRKGSVTSVFNGPASRHINGDAGTNNSSNNNNINNTSGQPTIITNGDSTNFVLIFDISCNNSLDEEDERQRQKDHNIRGIDKLADSKTNNNSGRIRLEVHLVSEHVSSNDYLVRNMYLINRTTGETRTVTQFHYLSWPLNGVPDNAKSLLSFRRKVHKSYRNLKSPILVHCNDGAGRSGTYTLIDIILERIKNGAKEIDPRATLEHLRDQRIGLCSTQSQFEFVLVALAEEIQLILNALPQ